jgi:hypothetical protein
MVKLSDGAIAAMLHALALFSNSFVVEEASVSAFVSTTLAFGMLAGLRDY